MGGVGSSDKMLVLMLVAMLVAATTLQPCLLASARQLCRWGCLPGEGGCPGSGSGRRPDRELSLRSLVKAS